MQISENEIVNASHKLKQLKYAWELLDDGEAFTTNSSLLQPVIYDTVKAMLKIPMRDEERRSSALMICWNGNGAAKVLNHNDDALLMERTVGPRSLRQMVLNGEEDEANKIICTVAARLHHNGCKQTIRLIPLPVWFEALKPAADKYGGILKSCSNIAEHLLDNPTDIVALHGDIHYDNILDSGTGEWLAIDPKALLGERGFDFANLFCNPNTEIAASRTRLAKQVRLVADEAKLDGKRLLQWIAAWGGLSAAWILNDGEDASLQMTVANIALMELISV